MSVRDLGGWFAARRTWCMELLRIYLGVGLVLKAVSFIVERDALVALVQANDMVWAGNGLAHWVIMTHLLGGTLMAVGMGTRVGALIQIPNLVGATFFVHRSGGLLAFSEEARFSALVLLLLVLFLWHGSGELSLRAYLRRSQALGGP